MCDCEAVEVTSGNVIIIHHQPPRFHEAEAILADAWATFARGLVWFQVFTATMIVTGWLTDWSFWPVAAWAAGWTVAARLLLGQRIDRDPTR